MPKQSRNITIRLFLATECFCVIFLAIWAFGAVGLILQLALSGKDGRWGKSELGVEMGSRIDYTGRVMEEPEDFNQFNSADCGGAVLMLGIVPAVMCFVFSEPTNYVLTVFIGVLALLAALVVWGLAAVTKWRLIPVLVNLAGCVLAPFYVAIAVYLWFFCE